jgi:molecular chaperone GrpE (heat shock protein)
MRQGWTHLWKPPPSVPSDQVFTLTEQPIDIPLPDGASPGDLRQRLVEKLKEIRQLKRELSKEQEEREQEAKSQRALLLEIIDEYEAFDLIMGEMETGKRSNPGPAVLDCLRARRRQMELILKRRGITFQEPAIGSAFIPGADQIQDKVPDTGQEEGTIVAVHKVRWLRGGEQFRPSEVDVAG